MITQLETNISAQEATFLNPTECSERIDTLEPGDVEHRNWLLKYIAAY